MNRPVCFFLLAAVLTGCASRVARVVPSSSASTALPIPYIDLQAGWRLRVITPLTRSGTYQIGLANETRTDGAVQLAAGQDFLGYETSFYSVQHRSRHGVRIQFASGEQTRDGVTSEEAHPQAQLFELPRRARYVRLLYPMRVSSRNHNMAVIAASREELLAGITAQVQADPQACKDNKETFCSWIPAGIAVRPERRNPKSSVWE